MEPKPVDIAVNYNFNSWVFRRSKPVIYLLTLPVFCKIFTYLQAPNYSICPEMFAFKISQAELGRQSLLLSSASG